MSRYIKKVQKDTSDVVVFIPTVDATGGGFGFWFLSLFEISVSLVKSFR